MINVNAFKDGLGNIVISEDSFDYLLACLDNQKFNPLPDSQNFIDYYNSECRKILHQKYIFETLENSYYLTKRYFYQDKITPWSSEDIVKVYELFKHTKIEWEAPKNLKPIENGYPVKGGLNGKKPLGIDENGWIIYEPESQPWLIERALISDDNYLTISENGKNNRPWKIEEISKIENIFNGYVAKREISHIEELWKHQIEKMDISFIEQHLRKLKLKKL